VTTTGATATVSLGAKGRVLIPIAVRHAAELTDGAELVVRSDGPGRIVVETRDAVQARVWADAPTPTGLDTTADVRAARDEDAAVSDRQSAERSAATTDDGAGDRLLAPLGLQ